MRHLITLHHQLIDESAAGEPDIAYFSFFFIHNQQQGLHLVRKHVRMRMIMTVAVIVKFIFREKCMLFVDIFSFKNNFDLPNAFSPNCL